MFKYLKAAFVNRWNLLALFAGVGVGLISNAPDVVFPLVAAAELGYMALLGSHPKFQKYVDAQQHNTARQDRSRRNKQVLRRILRSLPRDLMDRYNRLKDRCLELQRIAADLKQTGLEDADHALETLQIESLDRLLWIYLRLLFTYHSLHRFLDKTSLERIRNDAQRIENRLKLLEPEDASPYNQKMRRALADNLATCQKRIENYERARANFDFVELEIDRLENKIKSLAEVAVNRQEPDYVSNQVDQVARSMLETEKTMNDLQVFTGLGQVDEVVPVLLEEPMRMR